MFDALLKPKEVDCIFRWPFGKALAMFKQGRLSGLVLPDGKTIRFREQDILGMIHPEAAVRIAKELHEKEQ